MAPAQCSTSECTRPCCQNSTQCCSRCPSGHTRYCDRRESARNSHPSTSNGLFAATETEGISSLLSMELPRDRAIMALIQHQWSMVEAIDFLLANAEGEDETEILCPVCLEEKSNHHSLICQHTLCRDCFSTIAGLARPSCPLCRGEFREDAAGTREWIGYVVLAAPTAGSGQLGFHRATW